MATVKVKGFLAELEAICECSICYHAYDDKCHVPRVLPCQHIFCTECLSKHCKRRKLKCPLCNQEHNIKNESVDKLPKDFTTCNLRELLETFSKPLCKECQNQNQVKFICKTCDVQMCTICWDNKKQSSCNLHAVEIINDLSTTSAENNSTCSYYINICTISGHENNELKYFCCEKSCCLPVCANCVVEFHQYHSTKPVKDEYDTRKKIMQNKCQAAKKNINGANSVLESLLKIISLITEIHTIGQHNLKEQAMRGITYINEFEINSKKNTEEKFLQCLMLLEKKKEQVSSFIENAKECCSISEEALTGRSVVTFLSVEKTLRDKLAFFEQSDVVEPMNTMPDTADFELQAETLELKEKIDRMTNATNGIINKSTLYKGLESVHLYGKGKIEMVKKISFIELIFSIWLTLILLAIMLLWLNPIPYSHVFAIDETYLSPSKSRFTFNCYSVDDRTVSNIPMENTWQTCGNRNNRYIFRGAFTNSSLLYKHEDSFTIRVDISGIKTYASGVILFEFGISTGSIERRTLLGPHDAAFYGWALKILNSEKEVALINTKGDIIQSDTVSALDKTSYTFHIQLNSNKIMTLKSNNKNGILLDETSSLQGNYKLGFAKICSPSEARVTARLMSTTVEFNNSTLYPNLYIATDRKSISNKHLSSFSRRKIEDIALQDFMLSACDTSCVYVMNFRVNSPTTAEIFSLVLTNSQFLPSAYYNITLFTYTSCKVSNFRTYASHCIKIKQNDAKSSFFVLEPNKWHTVTILLNRKQKSASFFVGNHKIEVENGYLFERDTPILRWVMLTAEDSVEIRMGHRDEFDILTWSMYHVSSFTNNISSIITTAYPYLIFIIMIYSIINLCSGRETDIQVPVRAIPNVLPRRRFPFRRRR